VLAYAEGEGLPWDDLWARLATEIWRKDYTDADIQWLLEAARDYIVRDEHEGRGVYRLNHEQWATHLRRDDTKDRQAEIHRRFARVLEQHARSRATPLPDGGVDWRHAHWYTQTHLATHAARSGELDHLLEDPLFLLCAEPNRLLPELRHASTAGRKSVLVYQRAVHLMRGRPIEDAVSQLERIARRYGVNELMKRIEGSGLDQKWRVLWESSRRESPHRVLGGHEGCVRCVAWGEITSRPMIVSGSDDETVRVWDAESGVQRGEPLRGHEGSVFSVAWGEIAGRPVIVSGSRDRTVRVWDAESGVQRGEPLRHEGSVLCVAWGEIAGRPVIIAGTEVKVKVWDLSGHEILSIDSDGLVTDAKIGPGSTLAVASVNRISAIRLSLGRFL
jgi:hypothetical protein